MKKYLLIALSFICVQASAAPTWECYFEQGAGAEWVDEELEISNGVLSKDGPTKFEFEILDASANAAEFRANLGSSPVFYFETPKGITFIEQVPTGNVTISTIFAHNEPGVSLKAVHSRHVDAFGPLPSQYYGTCTKKRMITNKAFQRDEAAVSHLLQKAAKAAPRQLRP